MKGQEIKRISAFEEVVREEDGFKIVRYCDKYGIIDNDFNQIAEIEYDDISYEGDGIFIVKKIPKSDWLMRDTDHKKA